MILAAGANVVLCSGGMDDLCIKPLVEAHAIGVRRVRKEDLKHIAKATGGLPKLGLGGVVGLQAVQRRQTRSCARGQKQLCFCFKCAAQARSC